MTCRAARWCQSALDEATFLWSERHTASDGTCASAAHHAQNPGSDHEPNAQGLATAFDLTDDKDHGCDADMLAELVRQHQLPWIKYVIAERRMFSSYATSAHPAWTWRPYNGPNPHTSHVHFSILPAFINMTGQWWAPLLLDGEEADMTPGERQMLAEVHTMLQDLQPLVAAINHQVCGTFEQKARLARTARAADHYNKENNLA